MFSTKGISESGGKFITYGVREVKITGIEAKEAEGSAAPAIFVNFQELNSEKMLSVKFPFSEKAAQYSLRKIKHLATKIVTEAEVDNISGNVTQYAEQLSKLILNKSLRIKFSGDEIAARDGKKNWFKSVINFPPFAEAIDTNPTQLHFDSVKDLKKLAVVSATPSNGVTQKADLPF